MSDFSLYYCRLLFANRWPVIEEEKWENEKSDGKIVFGSDSERTSSDQPGDYCFVIGDDSATDDEMMFVENSSEFNHNNNNKHVY